MASRTSDAWEHGGEPSNVVGFPSPLDTQKTLPHSEESERAVLGALLLDPQLLPQVAQRLQPEDFYLHRHQALYGAMRELHGKGSPIDMRTLQAHLEAHDTFEGTGGIAYLASLDLDLPDLGRVDAYAEIVKERSIRRAIIQANGKAIRAVLEGDPLPELIEGQARALEAARRGTAGAAKGNYKSAWELSRVALASVDPEVTPEKLVEREVLSSLSRLNRLLVRFSPGALVVIAGAKKVGKTAFLLQELVANTRAGRRAAAQSLEMSEEQLALRLVCHLGGIDLHSLRSRQLSKGQWEKFTAATRILKSMPLMSDTTKRLGMREIGARWRRLAQEGGLDLAAVDLLNKIELENSRDSHALRMGRAAAECKNLADELAMPVFLTCQLGKEFVKEKREPTGDDIEYSSIIAQEADVVLLVHRGVDPENANRRLAAGKVIVAFNRDGETGEVPIVFDGWRQTMWEPE